MIRGAGHSDQGVEISKPFPNADHYRLDIHGSYNSAIIRKILRKEGLKYECDTKHYPTIIDVPMEQTK